MTVTVVAIVISVLVGQVICAPKPCLERCSRLTNSLGLSSEPQINLDYTRPGNWTEHNDYKTNNGAGLVHEEKGQFVNGGTKVRYYKKNYASSHGSHANLNDNEFEKHINAGSLHTEDHLLHPQLTIGQSNEQNYRQHNSYNEHRHHLTHSSGNSAKLEMIDDNTDSTLGTLGTSGGGRVVDTDNWRRENSYRTDGGRGKVYEEQGAYTQGPAKVHYYKRNYTAQYGTRDVPIQHLPTLDAQMHQIQSQLEQLSQQTHITDQQFQNIHNENSQFDQLSQVAHQPVQNLQNIHSSNSQLNQLSQQTHLTDQQFQNIHSENSQLDHLNLQTHQPTQHLQNIHVNNLHHDASTGGKIHRQSSEIHREEYHEQMHVPSSQESYTNYHQHHSQRQHVPSNDGLIRIPLHRVSTNNNLRDESSHSEYQQTIEKSHVPQHYINGQESLQHAMNNQEIRTYVVQPKAERHVEEHWSSTNHKTEFVVPQHQTILRDELNNHHLDNLGQQHYGISTVHGGLSDSNHQSSNRYISGGSTSYDSAVENLHIGHQASDCGLSHMQRRYRRDLELSQKHENLEDLSQQTQDLNQQARGLEDLSQQYQQQTGNFGLGQETQQIQDLSQYGQRGIEDYTQQQSGNYQFNQQNSRHEYGHQSQSHYHTQSDNLTQQTRNSGSLTRQQYSGNSEFGQQHQQYQTGGLEFGQQTHESPFEDYTQQTQDLRHQRTGNLEFGQQHQQPSGLEFDQQTHESPFGDYTQQTQNSRHQQHAGNLELGQVHQQQTGGLEFGQQTHESPFGDYTQQTQNSRHQQHAGNLRFGQENLQQQTGELEFGQQTYQSPYENYNQQIQSGNQHFDQSNNHQMHQQSQQTTGFASEQQTHQHPFDDDFHHHQDLARQRQPGNNQFDHHNDRAGIIQQSTGNNKFDWGQNEDLTQQTGDLSQITLQTSENQDHFHDSRPAPKPLPRSQRIGYPQQSEPNTEVIRPGVKGGRSRLSQQINSHQLHTDQVASQSHGVLSLEEQVQPTENEKQRETVFQPRILEAYGGTGSYSSDHHEDVFSGAKPNPTATLAPKVDGIDSWDVKEISPDEFSAKYVPTVASMPEYSIEGSTTTPAPGFWKRVGNKITNAYDKAKEKVTDVFG